eukprot:6531032-Lingulodinium_polyedra.AAC.1
MAAQPGEAAVAQPGGMVAQPGGAAAARPGGMVAQPLGPSLGPWETLWLPDGTGKLVHNPFSNSYGMHCRLHHGDCRLNR